jgi:hypothetical protein
MDLFLITQKMQNALPPFKEDEKRKFFLKQQDGRSYVCGVDCAEGVGRDWSRASMHDSQTREQAAVLRSRSKPHDFAHEVVQFCKEYTEKRQLPPLLGVERNNHGHAVLLELEEHLQYPNLYRHKDGRVGWVTDRVTRPIMMDAFIDGVENSTVTLHDRDTYQECLTLIDNNGKVEAAQGKHDDGVVAAAIAVQLSKSYAVSEIYQNIHERILI